MVEIRNFVPARMRRMRVNPTRGNLVAMAGKEAEAAGVAMVAPQAAGLAEEARNRVSALLTAHSHQSVVILPLILRE